ncbi:helix-turn-helix domain-containing protein [Microcoleus sp. ZQ-A2]|nr:helix-turn-helix domain-containing protein [Microcoleus sp. FACHB-1]
MQSRLTINIFEQAVERFTVAEASVLKDWCLPCSCPAPGEESNCEKCPYFRELVKRIQEKLHPAPAEAFPVILPPVIKPPYPSEVRQQCIELYRQQYSLEQIQQLTGVANRQTLRNWIRKAGEFKEAADYSHAERQRYVNLYIEGMSPRQIEASTGVPADLVNEWVNTAGASRPRKYYSDEQKEQALALYKQGLDVKEIELLTGVYARSVQSIAKRANLYRSRKSGGGRPPLHSPEVKQSCQKLLQEGKSPPQIEELLGVSADTVRRWKKQWEITADVVSPKNEPHTPDEASKPR